MSVAAGATVTVPNASTLILLDVATGATATVKLPTNQYAEGTSIYLVNDGATDVSLVKYDGSAFTPSPITLAANTLEKYVIKDGNLSLALSW